MTTSERVLARGAPPAGEGTAPSRESRHRFSARHIKPPRWLRGAVIASSLLPAAYLIFGFVSDLRAGTRYLGANPIEEMEHYTGSWNLRFLALTLSVTPAIRITNWGWLIRYRRIFGLFAFVYIALHLTIYFVLDVELSWSMLVEDVSMRLYITLGMAGFLLLIPLAITSTKGWIKRLGNKKWNRLHRLVYVSCVLGTIHFWMAVKRDFTDPLIFATIFAVLLTYRIVKGSRRPSRNDASAAPAPG